MSWWNPVIKKNSLLTNAFIMICSVVLTCIIGFIDYITGYYLNFFVFYYIAIVFVAWKTRIYYSFAIAQISIIVWLLADVLAGNEYSHVLYLIWNTFIRFISFFLIAYIVSMIREYYIKEKRVSEELRNALRQVKTLQGLLPICANCKKVRIEEEGYREQVEEYISKHSDIRFTHGICEDCAKKLYPVIFGETDLPVLEE
ncbi:MAG: hypothetical protein JXB88_27200 [Spirochaetales bacterium]|nr:hypothetical protein [Spirochaetales bacterium]